MVKTAGALELSPDPYPPKPQVLTQWLSLGVMAGRRMGEPQRGLGMFCLLIWVAVM